MRHTRMPGGDTWGSQVAFHRERLQLTQQQAAERIGVTRKTISRWESGKFKPDTMEGAAHAARMLGIDFQLAMRLTGFSLPETELVEDPYAWVRELGLDPESRVVRRILELPIPDELMLETLRQERENQIKDEERRLAGVEALGRALEQTTQPQPQPREQASN